MRAVAKIAGIVALIVGILVMIIGFVAVPDARAGVTGAKPSRTPCAVQR